MKNKGLPLEKMLLGLAIGGVLSGVRSVASPSKVRKKGSKKPVSEHLRDSVSEAVCAGVDEMKRDRTEQQNAKPESPKPSQPSPKRKPSEIPEAERRTEAENFLQNARTAVSRVAKMTPKELGNSYGAGYWKISEHPSLSLVNHPEEGGWGPVPATSIVCRACSHKRVSIPGGSSKPAAECRPDKIIAQMKAECPNGEAACSLKYMENG